MSQPKYFKSFKTRFAAINVNARRTLAITNEEISDNSSNLREALDEWREKCQTLDFDILYEKVYPLTRSYQLVIVHSNAIFQEILSIIDKDHKFDKDAATTVDDSDEVEDSSENEDSQLDDDNVPKMTIKTKPHILPISMDAVTSIINSFAKDIQSDIQPYLKFLLTSYAKILKSKENYEKTHVIDGIMSSISTILVYVWRELVASENKLLDFFETCCQEIFIKEMPRYIKDFCCESLAFLIRKCGTKLRQKLFGIYLINQDNESRRSTINSIIEYSILMSSNSEELASLSARKNLLSRKKKQGSDIFTKLDSIKIWFHSSAHEILLDYFNIISDNKTQLEQSALDFLKELSQHKIKGAEKVLIHIINRDIRLLEHYFEYFEWSKSISGPVELIKLYNLQNEINAKIALTIFTKYFSSDQYSNFHQDKLEVYEMLKTNQKSNLASLFQFFKDLFSNHEDYGIFQEVFVDDFCMEIDLNNEENYQNFRALVNLIVPEVIDFDDDEETTPQFQKFICDKKIAKIIQQNSDYETASKLNVKMVFTEKQLKSLKNFDIYQKLLLPVETFLDIYGSNWEIKTATDMILAKKMGLTEENFKGNKKQKMVYRYFSSFDRQAILSAINFLNFDKLAEIELDIQENLTLNNYNLQLQKIKRILKPENSDLPIEIKIRYLTSLYFINFSLIWREVDKILLEFVTYPEFYQIILEQIVENLILALDQGDSHSRDKENYNLHGVLDSLAIYGVSSYQHRVSIRRNKERNYNGKVDFFNLMVQIFKMLKNVPKLANDDKNLSIVFFRALISIFELIVEKKYESSKIQRIHKVSEVGIDKQRTGGSEEEEFQKQENSGQKNDDIIKTGIPYLKTIKAILPVITTCATNLAFNKMTVEDKSRTEKVENFIQSNLLRSSDYHLQELSLTALISLQKQNFENKNQLIEKTSQTLKNLCNAKRASDYKSNLLEMKAFLDHREVTE